MDPPKEQTPLHEERGGALKIRFSKSCRLDPPKEQTPLHEEGGGGPQNSIFEIMPLGPPKGADTPPRGERGGPSKFDFRNHAAWTPQRSRHPSTRRGPSKFDFRNHAAWTPQRSRHPSTRRVGGPQNSILEIMTLGPPKETDTPPRGGGGWEGALKIRYSES